MLSASFDRNQKLIPPAAARHSMCDMLSDLLGILCHSDFVLDPLRLRVYFLSCFRFVSVQFHNDQIIQRANSNTLSSVHRLHELGFPRSQISWLGPIQYFWDIYISSLTQYIFFVEKFANEQEVTRIISLHSEGNFGGTSIVLGWFKYDCECNDIAYVVPHFSLAIFLR